MSNACCNSCGAPNGAQKCSTCPTLICERCRTNHETVCAVNAKLRGFGAGPTVRQRIETPVVSELPPVPPVVYDNPFQHVDPNPDIVWTDAVTDPLTLNTRDGDLRLGVVPIPEYEAGIAAIDDPEFRETVDPLVPALAGEEPVEPLVGEPPVTE